MTKIITGFALVVLIIGLGFGGYVLFGRYFQGGGQVQDMLEVMSKAQTARVSVSINRFSNGDDSFVLGDVNIKGLVDLRVPTQVAYDFEVDVASVPGVSEKRANFLVRQVRGSTFINVVNGLDGIVTGVWNEMENSQQVLELLGDTFELVESSPEVSDILRDMVVQNNWFISPKATLTEIVHGNVTRIFTAELDPEGMLHFEKTILGLKGKVLEDESSDKWKDARVNLWIDQHTDELRRIIIQLGNGNQFDVEFEEINQDVEILLPSEEAALPSAESLDESVTQTQVETEEVEDMPVTNGDTDGDGLSDELEAFYGTNMNNPDTDGDGYTDGDEVNNGYNPTGSGGLFNFGLPTI